MNYLIYTPFRCGSSYVTRLIEQNIKSKPIFLNEFNEMQCIDDIHLVKGHNETVANSMHFDHIITCIRKPTSIYASAYFKDFKETTNIYPYYYADNVCEDNLNAIVEHFISFDWSKFPWLDYNVTFANIKKFFGVDLWAEPFNKSSGYVFEKNNNQMISAVTHDTIFQKEHSFKQYIKELGHNFPDNFKYTFKNSDVYGNLYYKFLQKIPSSFYKKYNDIDLQVADKFGFVI